LKFQAVAEKTAKDARGYFILPHPVVRPLERLQEGSGGYLSLEAQQIVRMLDDWNIMTEFGDMAE